MTRKISAFLALLAVAALIVVAPTPAPALTLEDVTVTWFNPLGPGIATVTNPFVEGAGNARNFEVRWGAPSADPTLQSGLGFDPLFPPSSEVPIGLNFTLGTLFHFNNPIFLGSQLTSVDLTLGAIFTSAIPALAEFTFRMLINETPNNGSPCDEGGAQPCRDAIRFTSLDVVPQTFTVDGETFTLLVIDEMLPACAPLARFCDVFCDRGAFTVSQAERILHAAAERGLRARLHAEQLTHTGAAALAAELGAVSADHLDHATPEDAAALAAAGVVAVLLPAASFSMRTAQAPARMLWDAGVTVALATDCNPGTSNVESMGLVIALGSLEMGLTPEEALWAATRGGALAVELPDRGSIVPGAIADLVVLDAPSYRHIPYRPGTNLVRMVVKGGKVV